MKGDLIFLIISAIGSFSVSGLFFIFSEEYAHYKWWFRMSAFLICGVVFTPVGSLAVGFGFACLVDDLIEYIKEKSIKV